MDCDTTCALAVGPHTSVGVGVEEVAVFRLHDFQKSIEVSTLTVSKNSRNLAHLKVLY